MTPLSHVAALSKVAELQDLCDLRAEIINDLRRVLTETRESIAQMVADRARQREDGPSADDNGGAFRALETLARDLGYEGRIEPANFAYIQARARALERRMELESVLDIGGEP